ncbi:thiol:disulfide interchange protein [Deinococcus metallilatus]|nr:thiol:disulfide interchange protein [Deinococcus metallilatus]
MPEHAPFTAHRASPALAQPEAPHPVGLAADRGKGFPGPQEGSFPVNSASPGTHVPTALWRRLLPPVLAAVLAATLGAALLNPARRTTSGGPLVGKPAPAFALQSLDGASVRLADLRGRPVVLNFWASWCTPCREEAPLFRELSGRQAAGQGLAVIGILFQETKEQNARDFIREFALAYPSLRDPQSKTAINYGVGGIPETVFIDRQGVVQHVDRGGLSRERLNVGLERIGVRGL